MPPLRGCRAPARPDRGAGRNRPHPASPRAAPARARLPPCAAGRIAGTRSLPPGPGARVEVEAGLAAARAAEPSVAVEDADELQLIGTFLRRPPPELRVAPLEADRILRLAAALPAPLAGPARRPARARAA